MGPIVIGKEMDVRKCNLPVLKEPETKDNPQRRNFRDPGLNWYLLHFFKKCMNLIL